MHIRNERPEDASAIELITAAAFRDAPHASGNEGRIPAALRAAQPAVASLAAGKRVDTSAIPALLQPLFAPQVQGFLISTMALDPARLAAGITQPLLIVQGEADIQTGIADAQRLAAAAPAAKLVRLPGVNHVLKQAPGTDRAANLATYADPELPLAPGVTEAIAAFVNTSSAAD